MLDTVSWLTMGKRKRDLEDVDVDSSYVKLSVSEKTLGITSYIQNFDQGKAISVYFPPCGAEI